MKRNEDKANLFAEAWQQFSGGMSAPVAEYGFDKFAGRRHRFDWAFIDERIGIEVDGGQWMTLGGRHARDSDREKMNLAAEMGWLVFRFSTDMLRRDPAGCVEQVVRAINNQR